MVLTKIVTQKVPKQIVTPKVPKQIVTPRVPKKAWSCEVKPVSTYEIWRLLERHCSEVCGGSAQESKK